MSKIINTESAGKNRNLLVKSVVVALRELLKQTDTGEETRDITAYISIALKSIADTVDESVAAWEKRGYWVKAERFRMDWEWTGFYAISYQGCIIERRLGCGGIPGSQDWSEIWHSESGREKPDRVTLERCIPDTYEVHKKNSFRSQEAAFLLIDKSYLGFRITRASATFNPLPVS